MGMRIAFQSLAAFCLSTTALTAPAVAASFSVGGGTINTSQADNSQDNTGTSGGFILQPNTAGNNDILTITGVTISNTSGTPTGRALDFGDTLPSSGSYSITMNGSNVSAKAGSGVAALVAESSNGNISFDSAGGAANTISGPIGINLNSNGGNISIKTGADTITTSSVTAEILYATTTGTGTISIDSVGATLTSNGLYGIAAVSGGSGLTTIGGLNGGIASTINVTNGSGIFTTTGGNQNITVAGGGVINALDGMTLQGLAANVDSFGTINATNNAIAVLNGTGTALTVTLEPGSVTKGAVVGGTSNDVVNIAGGAQIANATFDGGAGSNSFNLTGLPVSSGTLAVNTISNFSLFQDSSLGIWTLTGTTTKCDALDRDRWHAFHCQ